MIKKYIRYHDQKIFAVFYKDTKTLYYNKLFTWHMKVILFK